MNALDTSKTIADLAADAGYEGGSLDDVLAPEGPFLPWADLVAQVADASRRADDPNTTRALLVATMVLARETIRRLDGYMKG